MNKWWIVTGCILAVGLGMAGCATKVIMKPTGFAVGGGIDEETGYLNGKRDVFHVSHDQAVAWAEFENAHGDHTARFQWFNPKGELVHDSGVIPVTPDAEGEMYAKRRVWSTLPIYEAPASLMPGKWRVKVWMDEDEVEELSLKIKR